MSLIDKLSNVFSKNSAEPAAETSGDLSLGTPDASIDPLMATGGMQAPAHVAPADPDSLAQDASVAPLDSIQDAELLSVPLLGRRSIVTHPRILFTLLAV